MDGTRCAGFRASLHLLGSTGRPDSDGLDVIDGLSEADARETAGHLGLLCAALAAGLTFSESGVMGSPEIRTEPGWDGRKRAEAHLASAVSADPGLAGALSRDLAQIACGPLASMAWSLAGYLAPPGQHGQLVAAIAAAEDAAAIAVTIAGFTWPAS